MLSRVVMSMLSALASGTSSAAARNTILPLVLLACWTGTALGHMGIDASEFRSRR